MQLHFFVMSALSKDYSAHAPVGRWYEKVDYLRFTNMIYFMAYTYRD